MQEIRWLESLNAVVNSMSRNITSIQSFDKQNNESTQK